MDASVLTRLDHSPMHEVVNDSGVAVYSCKDNALVSGASLLDRVEDGSEISQGPFLGQSNWQNPLELGILA